jgi:lysophospholipase L1-like esterase/dienelactone hydrolase
MMTNSIELSKACTNQMTTNQLQSKRLPILMATKSIAAAFVLMLFFGSANAQDPLWDDTNRPLWPEACKEVAIPSSADGKIQQAYFYATSLQKPMPLIVSLHTWSNNYQQEDPLLEDILKKDYNYIRPNFRGPNNTSEACGSPLVISDIDDAITYALQNSDVDPDNIHIIGVSGGGHATLLSYMRSQHDIRSFSAWVPISDLTKWYYESLGRNRKYASHIALATTGTDWKIDIQEAQKRSPLYLKTPLEKRKNSKLYIYAGIHDGYDGSVPVTHSLEMYNKVVKDFNPTAADAMISLETIQQIVAGRFLPGKKKEKISGRDIHLKKTFEGKVQIIIFEGNHEMLTAAALKHIPSETLLAIGDSNGENQGGWVDQLQTHWFKDVLINTCISGNTIGFDNSGLPSKNTLRNIIGHLEAHDPGKDKLDKILIMLGTNDCKKVFHERLEEVPGFYNQLIDTIRAYYQNSECPEIIMISPPPIGEDQVLKDKYHGSAERVRFLNDAFKKVARGQGIRYIDIQTPLSLFSNFLLRDGIHFNKEGYQFLGLLLNHHIDDLQQSKINNK